MRSGSRLAVLCGTLAVLVLSSIPATPAVVATTASTSPSPSPSGTGQLVARRAQLEQQLASASGASADARRQLIAAQRALADVQRRLGQSRNQLDTLDARLKTLTRQIATDMLGLDAAKQELAALVRVTYETTGSDGFADVILSSNSFGEAMDRVRTAEHVTDEVASLQDTISTKEKALLDHRTQLQQDFATAESLESTLSDQSGRLMALVAQRDQMVQQLQGPARTLAAQIAVIDDQLTNTVSGPVNPSSPCGNRFAFGNCTYYVATRRCIPWLGNAYQWWANARAAGFAEGQQPARGAVVVWGISASSPVGHVAYVEGVGPAGGIPAGSFLISEMNYRGFDVVDYRTVPIGAPGILGFIYGRAG